MYYIPRSFTYLAFGGLAVVYIMGLFFPDLMEVDASQYASISMEMERYGSYLEVHHLFDNYLDKPPLLFWLGALFMKLFGVNHVAYRLPTLLSTVLGIYATYRLGRMLYNRNTGILSALFLASSQIYILHNHDVRTDTLLTNFAIFAIWQLAEYLNNRKPKNFVLAFTGMGLAMLTKGPIGMMVPVLAIGSQLVYRRRWSDIFNWRWLIGALIILLILLPMLIGLYTQFDANPEAMVNGKKGVSGLRFYFWEQSFGRITGENVWKNDATYFFFTHNFLWEFLPWSVMGVIAIFIRFKNLVVTRFRSMPDLEVLTFGGFVLPFIALSMSHYKLPHYIMVIMPMAAILTADLADKMLSGKYRWTPVVAGYQFVQSILILTVLIIIIFWIFPTSSVWWWILVLLLFMILIFEFFQGPITRLIGVSLTAIIGANIVMNGYFYPQLNEFQAGTKLAEYITKHNIGKSDLLLFRQHYHNLNFYSGEFYDWVDLARIEEERKTRDVYVFTNDEGLKKIYDDSIPYRTVKIFWNYPNTELSGGFLNPKTRIETLTPNYLIQVPKENPEK